METDTRKLSGGAWFVALVGERFDGHAFLDRATEAAGCVVQRRPSAREWQGGIVVVPDTTKALQDLGRFARSELVGPVVGVTGSAGKTTTRALIALALSPLGVVNATEGNLNNHLGVPMTLCAAAPGAAATVVEMGTSSPGEIRFLAEMARPNVRLIVNVGAGHLEELGGLDGVAMEKGEIFATATAGDVCCINFDDPLVAALPIPGGVRMLGYGAAPESDVRLVAASIDPVRLVTRASIAVAGHPVEVEIPVPGLHLAHNAAAALAVAYACGVDPQTAAHAMARYEPVGMRMRSETLPGPVHVINDAYNANPTSMRASLDTLAALPGRRVAVLGDMLELGGDESAFHDEIARHAHQLGIELVVLVGQRMALAAMDLPADHVWRAEQGPRIAGDLAAWLQPTDRVLFKGSRGARVERVLQAVEQMLRNHEEAVQ